MPKGFFASLFDISFKSFITTKVISILYVLIMIVLGIGAVGFVIAGFAADSATGLLFLFLAPIGFILYLLIIRVYLEVVVILFRIHDNTAATAGRASSGAFPVPGGAAPGPQAPRAPEAPQVQQPPPGGGALQSFTQPPPANPGQPPQGPQSPGR